MTLKELLPCIYEGCQVEVLVGPKRLYLNQYGKDNIISIFGDYEVEESSINVGNYYGTDGSMHTYMEIWSIAPKNNKEL